MALKLPATLLLPPVPKNKEELFGLNGYFLQLDNALKSFAKDIYRALTYLTRSTTFNATSDWGSASGGYYTFTFAHNLDLSQTLVGVWDMTSGELAVGVDRVSVDDRNTVSIRVTSSPDLRFAGRLVAIGL